MANRSRVRYYKFFRRLIATSQPEQIPDILKKYSDQHKLLEENYLDIVINSDGAFSYQDIVQMPLPSIVLLVERLNKRAERMSGNAKQML
tara:strand:+ start:1967 stop:2236 length:270 start_codon:yes stop_codon:yes gene_type:complete